LQKISLKKYILPGSLRYLGKLCPNISPSSIPIAGYTYYEITKKINGEAYQIGSIKVKNAFIVIKGNARFLYVRPKYSTYRKAAERVFSKINWDIDYDHALSKRIAMQASPTYKYILLLRVPPSVNRQHGSFEKKDNLLKKSPSFCFADDRILDKWLARPPKARNRSNHVMSGYSQNNITKYGLTLKQRGQWAYAIGIGDENLVINFLQKI